MGGATNGLSDEHLAQIVREDQIDVLVDLTMHMEGGHFCLLASRRRFRFAGWRIRAPRD